MPEACDGSRRSGRRRAATRCVLGALALALIALAAVLGGGCTSDPANPTGSGISGGLQFDSLLATLRADTLRTFGELRVFDPKIPFSHYQVLYMGKRGSERSSILARYNFATSIDTLPAGSEVTVENIQSVTLFLFQLKPYQSTAKFYKVYNLATPLDSTLYVGPDLPPEPPTAALIASKVSAGGETITIPLPPDRFVQWYQQGIPNGIMIAEGDTTTDVSFPGIAGYGSKELTDPEDAIGKVGGVGPLISVEFKSLPNPAPANNTVRWQALIDVSSFASVLPLPATPVEGLVLRTHLRAYPFLSFALDRLPPNAFINRAVLSVTNDPDTLQSYGTLVNVICGEIPNQVLPRSGRPDSTFSLDSLATRVRIVSDQKAVDPKTLRHLELDVTLSIQRLVNGVYQRPFSFLLFSDEAFTGPAFHDSRYTPDFYLRRLHFLGTEAPDPLDRPQLKIYYTLRNPIGGKSLGKAPAGRTP